MEGIDAEAIENLKAAAGDAQLTVAGGFTTAEDIAVADRLGADAQVGMALYSGRLHLADAIAAPLTSDRPDGLWPTVVADEYGVALGLAYSDLKSLRAAVDGRVGAYHSRNRGLWIKGKTSGATQDLLKIDLDCDRDTLRFTVRQTPPGFCHLDTHTCWGDAHGLPALARLIAARRDAAPEGSYTRRLFEEAGLLDAKILEEAQELVDAASPDEVTHEAADLIYFALTAMARSGVALSDVEAELERRSRRLTRRSGNKKT
jgi:phosphoribosyl-ATP pyrophosphohydrolase